ncbi:ThuA domain-containing protein [Blastomonas sp. SL216]|uniref:ThuA domain-containing protein n=1 Tax=Blastomonas sp. SL216 TaxID=2995169 RepID=UPI002376D34F|nr:ThuA domain-containing protein [Blastomonas sp. SL216]
MIELLLALALQPVPYVKNPKYWPTPVMDEASPPLPPLKRGAVLVLSKTNGYRDDEQIVAATIAIQEIVKDGGRDVFATENAAVMNPRDLAQFKVVVLNSTSGNIFTESQRTAFRQWVEGGGGVVLLHGAGGDHHYDWPWYRNALLGVQFIGHTSKPDQFQQGDIHVTTPRHKVMRGIPAKWTRTEEWYAFDRVPTGQNTRIVATLDEASYRPAPEQRMGASHPIVWTRCVARGRSIFSALGHQAQSYAEPLHRRLIGNAIEWAAGKRC